MLVIDIGRTTQIAEIERQAGNASRRPRAIGQGFSAQAAWLHRKVRLRLQPLAPIAMDAGPLSAAIDALGGADLAVSDIDATSCRKFGDIC